jgi:hypothetical protein
MMVHTVVFERLPIQFNPKTLQCGSMQKNSDTILNSAQLL